jgi:hypothetical protein
MSQKTWEFIGAPDCANRSMANLMSEPQKFIEAVTLKTDTIEKAGLGGTPLLSDVYLLRDLVRDVLSKNYDICFLTMAHICVALDYFVTNLDANPDHRQGGLHDDLKVIIRTKEKFKKEIDEYLKWRKL